MPTVKLYRGDCLDVLAKLPAGSVDAVVADPPYGMRCKLNSRRFTGGQRTGDAGRADWPIIRGDEKPFNPAPWLDFPKVILFGANHYAQRLPVGTTLVWVKKADHLFGTFLSDAEVAWMKGGHGVYCFRKQFPPSSRAFEAQDRRPAHPMQKPVALMRWCIERLRLPAGAAILDPYMGSGSTGVAAVQLGYNFIGIESDPIYFAAGKRRITSAVREADRALVGV